METDGINRWNWSGGNSTISVSALAPVDVILTGIMACTAWPDEIAISLDGQPAGRIQCESGATYDLNITLRLAPGEHQITFIAGREPVSMGNDPRRLSFILRNFSLEKK